MSRKTMGLMARTIAQSLRFVASTIAICSMAIGTSAWASVAQTYNNHVPSSEPVTVFTGVALSELGTKYALGATFDGAWMQAGEAFPWTFSRTEDSLTVEFRRIDTASAQTYTKAIPVTFTQNGSDIQAVAGTPRFAESVYLSATLNDTQTNTDNDGNPVYRVSSLTLTPKTESINISFTHNNQRITDETIISGIGQYAIAGAKWDTFGGFNTSGTGVFIGDNGGVYKLGLDGEKTAVEGASVKVENSSGSWYCTYNDSNAPNINGSKYFMWGYIDDNSNYLLPKVTVTGVPFTRYRVVTYFSTDTMNRKFGPITINGNISLMGNSEKTATVTGSDFWGGADWKGPLQEGKNYLVSPLLSGDELTIQGKANSSQGNGRAGISAISIVEVLPAVRNVADGGTYELDLDAEIAEAGYVKFVCDGTFTLKGKEDRTITESDIANYLDFTDVTGSVMLGAYTFYDLGEERVLPGGKIAFGEDSTVGMTETRKEYANDKIFVEGLTGVSYVQLTRLFDESERIEVENDTIELGNGTDIKISGEATMIDATFTNTTTLAYKAISGAGIGTDSNVLEPYYNNELEDETTGMYIRHHPWISGVNSAFNSLSDFTAVVVGQMSPASKTQFIHMGSSNDSNKGLLIATTSDKDTVIITTNTGSAVDEQNAVTVSVPNAASARHAYVIIKTGITFNVWVDGIKRGSFSVSNDFALGASGNSGLQVGSDFGGAIKNLQTADKYQAVPNSAEETGVVNVIRIFDYAISDAQAEAVVAAYPYVSEGGLYTRTIDDDANFSAADEWKGDDDEDYTVPVSANEVDNPSATITVEAKATVTVNASLTLDTLTIGGAETLTFAKSGGSAVKVSGAAVFNSPVVVEYGALDLAGTPVQLGSAGLLTIDCSSIDVASIYRTTHYQLTGLIEEDPDKFEVLFPEAAPYREVAAEYNANGYYELVVTPDHEAESDVYYASGYIGTTESTFSVTNALGAATMVFPGDTIVVPAYHDGSSAYFGATLPANVSVIRVEKDLSFEPGVSDQILGEVTVTVSDGKELTFGAKWHGLNLGAVTLNGPGAVKIDGSKTGSATDAAAGTFKVSGAVAGTATITVAEGKSVTVESTGSIANTIVLEDGATLTVKDGGSVTTPTTNVEGKKVNGVESDGTTVYSVVSAGINIGESKIVEAEDEASAINLVDLAITVPAEVASNIGIEKGVYAGYFKKVATQNTDGTWTVRAELDPEMVFDDSAAAENSSAILAGVLSGVDSVTLDGAQLGLYYSIEGSTALDFVESVNGGSTLAGELSIPVAVPEVEGDSAFFRIRVSPKAISPTTANSDE